MENVPGILSSNNGKTFESIKSEFAFLGYKVEAQNLMASDFGVPQKRKRVFIVGLKDKNPMFNPAKILSEDRYITVNDALSDLYDIPPVSHKEEEISILDNTPLTLYQSFLKRKITFQEFLNLLSNSEAID
jgi:site-specific DNA-cytosine methylase